MFCLASSSLSDYYFVSYSNQINLFFRFNQGGTSFLSVFLYPKPWKLFLEFRKKTAQFGNAEAAHFFHTRLPPSNHIFSPGSCPVQPQACAVGDQVSLGLLGVKCSFRPAIHYSWQKSLEVDTQR